MRGTKFNWPTGLFIIGYHLALLIILPLYLMYYSPSWGMWTATIVLYFLTGMSITGGYHRFFSHQAYKAHPAVEAVLLFFGSMATQGSALRWSFEHRIHHAYVDTDNDPYSIKKGFWYAHIMWLFHEPMPIDKKVVSDLTRNKMVMYQHNNYLFTMIATNVLAFLFVGWLLNDYVGAFVLSWWTRLFFLHHSTWFINSLAHTWGARTFSQEQTAVDNFIISLLTFGEGYHNYHHTFANDYRNGIRWFHFDPTKWLIWTLNRLGLAYSLKRVGKYHIKERLVNDHKQELLQVIKKSITSGADELCEKVSKLSEDMNNKLSRLRTLADTSSSGRADATTSKEIKTLKKGFREEWKQFHHLYKNVMRHRTTS